MAFERSSSADTDDFTEGILNGMTVCAMNLAKITRKVYQDELLDKRSR